MRGGVAAALIIVTSLLPVKYVAAYCFDCFGFHFVCLHLLRHVLYFLWMDFHPCLYIYTEFSLFSQWYKEPCLVYIKNLEKFPNVVGGYLVW
jgi:hypothetical protein